MQSLKTIAKQDPSELSIEELRLLIDKADASYYRTDLQSSIPDSVYDAAKKRLKELAPDDERNTRIGWAFSVEDLRNKVEHSIPMGSLDNTDDGIIGYEKWYRGCCSKLNVGDTRIFASLKVDGSSIRARYENGKLKVVATRGNGEIGEDITINGINFQNLPLQLPENITCDVRGEAILYIKDFQTLMEAEHGKPFDQIPSKEISNPRNVGNGILSRDSGEHSNLIRFLAFNVVIEGEKFESECHKFQRLSELGFQPVPHESCDSLDDVHKFYNTIANKRDKLPFEIDGIVVVIDKHNHQNFFVTDDIKTQLRPKHSRAIKFPHKSGITRIIGVDITVGHTGAIVPTAIFNEVRIGGVNVQHALLNNWDEISRLGIDVGDEVEVVLAGDIIPKVIRCVKKHSQNKVIPEPKCCPSCGKETTRELRGKAGAVTYCTDPVNCSAAMLAKIDHWIGGSKKGVGILGIGDTMLAALWQQGIVKDPSDLYVLTINDLKDIQLDGGGRIGEARAKTIVDNINGKRNLPIHMFLGSLGIELLGRRRVQILQKAANGQLDNLDQWLDTESFRSLQIEGLGDTIRQSIVDGIEANRDLIQRFLDKGVIVGQQITSDAADVADTVIDNTKPFAGMSFCLTGTRECQDDIERLGGELKSGVSKNLTFLVQKDALSSSNKTLKAEQYGVRVISIDYLKKAIAGKVSLTEVHAVVPQPHESNKRSESEDIDALVDDLV